MASWGTMKTRLSAWTSTPVSATPFSSGPPLLPRSLPAARPGSCRELPAGQRVPENVRDWEYRKKEAGILRRFLGVFWKVLFVCLGFFLLSVYGDFLLLTVSLPPSPSSMISREGRRVPSASFFSLSPSSPCLSIAIVLTGCLGARVSFCPRASRAPIAELPGGSGAKEWGARRTPLLFSESPANLRVFSAETVPP